MAKIQINESTRYRLTAYFNIGRVLSNSDKLRGRLFSAIDSYKFIAPIHYKRHAIVGLYVYDHSLWLNLAF